VKTIVCIKQVPDTTEIKINPETNTLMREGVPSIINPFDLYALEEALMLRDQFGGTVTVLSMGPPQAMEALREAISIGADDAVLLSDRAFAGSDTWATSYVLAKGIDTLGGADLILCGKQAIDGDTAQVGPGIAHYLGLPFVAFVRAIIGAKEDSLVAERVQEDGTEHIEMPLPGVLTIVKGKNEPRMPSLRGKMKARKAEIPTWGAVDIEADPDHIGLESSPTRVIKIFSPERRKGGEMFHGDVQQKAEALYERLHAGNLV